MSDATVRVLLRAIAVAIAIAAAIDPAVTSNRRVAPVVVVSTLDSIRDASLMQRVSRTLNKAFIVSTTPVAGASAAVVIGDRLPNMEDDVSTPTFVVAPDTTTPSVSIDRVDVPAESSPDARVPVSVRVTVHGAAGRSVEVTLRAGASVADHVVRRFNGNDSTLTVALSFVPAASGAMALRATAALSGAPTPAIADAAVNVRDRRWAVLFFDARPSWTSTFVRRAVERDSRFVVTSRVVTSRNVSTDAGRPPVTFGDLAALSVFDAIVVGAPEGLSSADVAALDAFMRRRGGNVVLLLDQRVAGAYDRLTAVSTWTSSTRSVSIGSPGPDSATLRATEIASPAALPAGASIIAGSPRPVVWTSPVGPGRLIVSGALDAWRFRDPSTSGFDRFWRTLIAESAAAAPPAVDVGVSRSIATPGQRIEVHAVVRDAALRPSFIDATQSQAVHASVSVRLDRAQGSRGGRQATAIRVWPEPELGQFRGRFRAPLAPGVYRIGVTSNGITAEVPLVVAADVRYAARPTRALLSSWATVHGGRMLGASEIEQLPAALDAVIRPPSRVETRHLMRSAWWIVPFVLALSVEWWLRRRRGLR